MKGISESGMPRCKQDLQAGRSALAEANPECFAGLTFCKAKGNDDAKRCASP